MFEHPPVDAGVQLFGWYPFFVKVITVGEEQSCGGTLVGANAVLTAAQCLYNKWVKF